jgi:hypothetical protein
MAGLPFHLASLAEKTFEQLTYAEYTATEEYVVEQWMQGMKESDLKNKYFVTMLSIQMQSWFGSDMSDWEEVLEGQMGKVLQGHAKLCDEILGKQYLDHYYMHSSLLHHKRLHEKSMIERSYSAMDRLFGMVDTYEELAKKAMEIRPSLWSFQKKVFQEYLENRFSIMRDTFRQGQQQKVLERIPVDGLVVR